MAPRESVLAAGHGIDTLASRNMEQPGSIAREIETRVAEAVTVLKFQDLTSCDGGKTVEVCCERI